EYCALSCISRGGLTVLVICPKVDGAVMPTNDGCRNEGWFNTLNASTLKSSTCRSCKWKCLARARSQFCWNGPRKAFRGTVPKPVGVVAVAGLVKPAGPFATTGAGAKHAGFRYPNPLPIWLCTLPGV